jgi:betaine-homocysteine S-methyltransferase
MEGLCRPIMRAVIARDAATTRGRGWRCVLLWASVCLLSRGTTRPFTTEEEEYMTESTPEVPSGDLTARLNAGPVICAEGFLFELERRGYLSAGEFVPEVALEYPDALRALHVDFQRAGSDVVEAFTYNGHREKMRVIGKEDLLEPLNRAALRIAREVADQ